MSYSYIIIDPMLYFIFRNIMTSDPGRSLLADKRLHLFIDIDMDMSRSSPVAASPLTSWRMPSVQMSRHLRLCTREVIALGSVFTR